MRREEAGVVSIFLDVGFEALREMLSFDEDQSEAGGGGGAAPIRALVTGSYSASYVEAVEAAARGLGVTTASSFVALFDRDAGLDLQPGPLGGDGGVFVGAFAFDRRAREIDLPRRVRESLGQAEGRLWIERADVPLAELVRLLRRAGHPDPLGVGPLAGLPAVVWSGSLGWAQHLAEGLERLGCTTRIETIALPADRSELVARLVRGVEETLRTPGISIAAWLASARGEPPGAAPRVVPVSVAPSVGAELRAIAEELPGAARAELFAELEAAAGRLSAAPYGGEKDPRCDGMFRRVRVGGLSLYFDHGAAAGVRVVALMRDSVTR